MQVGTVSQFKCVLFLLFLIDVIHDIRHLCPRLRTDGRKSMSLCFSAKKLPIEEIAVEFVYSINRQQEKKTFSS